MTRSALAFLALGLCVGGFVLVTNGTARTVSKTLNTDIRAAKPSILFIGDSLSAGPFGEAVQQHLVQQYGVLNVAAYASCGSSPEHWLEGEPGFYTRCGFRVAAPGQPPFYTDGSTRVRKLTPKLETLVKRHRPQVVIVQLGTNWMDRNLTAAQMNSFADRFIKPRAVPACGRSSGWPRPIPPPSIALRKTAFTPSSNKRGSETILRSSIPAN